MYIEVGEKLAPAMIFSTNALNIFLRTMMALPKIISDNRVLIVSLVGAVLAYNGALIASIAVSVWERAAKLLSIKSTALQILMTEAQTAQIAKLTIVQKAAVVKTGYYSKPTLGLFSEREPEIVIDGPTTRNIKANFPEILGAINAARVNQYAGGMYPDLGGTSQQSAMQIAALLRANMQMMRQVQKSHERPAVVSFQSIRDSQADYDFIKSKTTI
jgi:hypothetical protein